MRSLYEDKKDRYFGGTRLPPAKAICSVCGGHFMALSVRHLALRRVITLQTNLRLFTDKVASVRAATATTPLYDVPYKTTSQLTEWTVVTVDEVEKLIGSAPTKTCQLDPVPTWLVKECAVCCHLSSFCCAIHHWSLAAFLWNLNRPLFTHC